MLKIGMACICGVLWAGASFSAEVPSMINYQGALVDNEGKPLATGEYTLEFEIYDALTNGALVWGPMVFDGVTAFGHAAKAQVVEGNFNVLLGPIDTSKRPLINAFGGTARYVSIKVHDPVTKAVHTLAPRQQILSVPFALNAQYAATAQTVAAGVVDAAAMADGAALEEISDNDGAGSGLDADTVDGKHASEFMAANKDIWVDAQGDTLTGVLAINGKLAVGRADADTKLHVQGGNWDLTNTDGDVKIGNSGYELKMGIATSGGGAGDARIRSQGGTNRLILGAGINDALAMDSAGRVGIGILAPEQKLDVNGNVQTTGEYLYSGPRTFRLFLSAAAFNPANLQTSSDWRVTSNNRGYIETFGSSDDIALCAPVNLPQGAQVTKMKVYYFDNSSWSIYIDAKLQKGQAYVGDAVPAVTMAQITFHSGTLGTSPDVRSYSDETIVEPQISNLSYSYAVQIDYVQEALDEGLIPTFVGVGIEYTVTKASGE